MRRPPLWLACCLALVAGPLQAGPLLAQDSLFQADSAEPPARVARLAYLQGEVSFQPADDTAWTPANLNYPIATGDRLFAGPDARAEVQVGPSTVRLAEYTDMTLINLTDHLLQLGVTQGTARITVYEMGPDDSLEVDTPHGALVLQAPGEYRIDAALGDTALVVSAGGGGILQWTAGGVAQTVASGQAILVTGVNPIQVASVTPPRPDAFDKWSAARDANASASPSAQYVSRDIPGYQDLDQAGNWRVEASYGPVWYPSAIPVGWVPYRYGHWVWVWPWGWTWIENAHWGYAPFHYGRWVYLHARWGWVPGPRVARPYYAPALVVFVDGGAIGPRAQGWFPLGPGEPYYPWYHHDREYLRRVNVTNMRQLRDPAILNDASYINRIQYRNRRQGTTVVPETAFRGGQSLGRQVMRVRPADVAAARIAPRAQVQPTPRERSGLGPVAERRPAAPQRPSWVVAPAPRGAPPSGADRRVVVPRTEPQPHAGPVLITRTPPPSVGRRALPQPKAGPQPAAPPPPGRRDEAPPTPEPALPAQPAREPRVEPAPKPRSEPVPREQPAEPRHAQPAAPRAQPAAPRPAEPSAQPRSQPSAQPRSQPAAKPQARPAPAARSHPQEKPKPKSDSGGRRGPGD
jgi:hypothetical protein